VCFMFLFERNCRQRRKGVGRRQLHCWLWELDLEMCLVGILLSGNWSGGATTAMQGKQKKIVKIMSLISWNLQLQSLYSLYCAFEQSCMKTVSCPLSSWRHLRRGLCVCTSND
jgi:hypothetical protein